MSNYVCNHRTLPDCDAAVPGVHNPLGDVMSNLSRRSLVVGAAAVPAAHEAESRQPECVVAPERPDTVRVFGELQ